MSKDEFVATLFVVLVTWGMVLSTPEARRERKEMNLYRAQVAQALQAMESRLAARTHEQIDHDLSMAYLRWACGEGAIRVMEDEICLNLDVVNKQIVGEDDVTLTRPRRQ